MGDHQHPPTPGKAQATAEPQLTPVSALGKMYQDTFGRAFSDADVLAHRSKRPKARRSISSSHFFDVPSAEEREQDQSARARPSNRLLRHSSADSPGGLSSTQTSPKVDQHRQFLSRTPAKTRDQGNEDDENSAAAVQPTRLFTAVPTSSLTPDTPTWSSRSSISTPMTWSTRGIGIRSDLGTTGVTASNSFLAQMVRARGASSGRATPSAKNEDDDKELDHAPLDSDFDISQSYEDSDWEFDAKFDGERELSDGEAAEPDPGSDAVHGELGTSLSGRTLIDETEDIGDKDTASSGKGKEVDRHALERSPEAGRASPCQDDHPSYTTTTPSGSSQDLNPPSPQTPPSCLRRGRGASLTDTSNNDPEAAPNPSVYEGLSSRTGTAASAASIRKRIEFLIPTEHGPKRCAPGEDDSAEEDHVAGGGSGAGPSTAALTPGPAPPRVPEEPIVRRISSRLIHRNRASDTVIDASQVAEVAQPPEYNQEPSLNESVTSPGTGEGRDVSACDGPWTIVITVPSDYNAFHQLGEALHGLVQYWQAAIVNGGPPTPLPPDPRWGLVSMFGRSWPDSWHPFIMEIMICIVWLIIGCLELIELVYCIGMKLWYGRHVRMRL